MHHTIFKGVQSFLHILRYTCITQCPTVARMAAAVKGSKIVHAISVFARVAGFTFIDVFNENV